MGAFGIGAACTFSFLLFIVLAEVLNTTLFIVKCHVSAGYRDYYFVTPFLRTGWAITALNKSYLNESQWHLTVIFLENNRSSCRVTLRPIPEAEGYAVCRGKENHPTAALQLMNTLLLPPVKKREARYFILTGVMFEKQVNLWNSVYTTRKGRDSHSCNLDDQAQCTQCWPIINPVILTLKQIFVLISEQNCKEHSSAGPKLKHLWSIWKAIQNLTKPWNQSYSLQQCSDFLSA